MNFDKLMTTMKEKDEVTKERDDMTKEKDNLKKDEDLKIQAKMQAKLKQSLEETDLKLLDVKINAIKQISTQEKVD